MKYLATKKHMIRCIMDEIDYSQIMKGNPSSVIIDLSETGTIDSDYDALEITFEIEDRDKLPKVRTPSPKGKASRAFATQAISAEGYICSSFLL